MEIPCWYSPEPTAGKSHRKILPYFCPIYSTLRTINNMVSGTGRSGEIFYVKYFHPVLWIILYSPERCTCVCAQSCPTLCDPIDCSPPGSSVHSILQARMLEWVAIPFSRGSSWPGDWTHISCTAHGFFTTEAPGKPPTGYVLFPHLTCVHI